MSKHEKPKAGHVVIDGMGVRPSWLYRGYLVIGLSGADYGRRKWVRDEKAWKIRELESGKEFDLIPSADHQPNLKEALWYVDQLIKIYANADKKYGHNGGGA